MSLLSIAIIILLVWLGFHLISWAIGGLVDVTGGLINLLVVVAVVLIIVYIIKRIQER